MKNNPPMLIRILITTCTSRILVTTCTLKSRLHILSTLKNFKVATILTGMSLSMQTSLPGANNLWPLIGGSAIVEIEIFRVFQLLDAPDSYEMLKDSKICLSLNHSKPFTPQKLYCNCLHLGSSESPERRLPEWKLWLPLHNSSTSTFSIGAKPGTAVCSCHELPRAELLTECSNQVVQMVEMRYKSVLSEELGYQLAQNLTIFRVAFKAKLKLKIYWFPRRIKHFR